MSSSYEMSCGRPKVDSTSQQQGSLVLSHSYTCSCPPAANAIKTHRKAVSALAAFCEDAGVHCLKTLEDGATGMGVTDDVNDHRMSAATLAATIGAAVKVLKDEKVGRKAAEIQQGTELNAQSQSCIALANGKKASSDAGYDNRHLATTSLVAFNPAGAGSGGGGKAKDEVRARNVLKARELDLRDRVLKLHEAEAHIARMEHQAAGVTKLLSPPKHTPPSSGAPPLRLMDSLATSPPTM